jgi:hypothetical protein
MADFIATFAALRTILAKYEKQLVVKIDTTDEYSLVTKSPSPFPQHKGMPLWFGAVKVGKSYVSFHLMPLYMCPKLTGSMSSALKRRMQGKTCFNFKSDPPPELANELERLAGDSLLQWRNLKWI